jgi:hypothetical protein
VNHWVPAGVAAAVLGVVAFAGVAGGRGGSPSAETSPSTVVAADTTPVPVESTGTVPTTITPPTTGDSTAVGNPVPINRAVGLGMVGDDVERIQQRLTDLHFDPGPVDGYFGKATRQAVWAFEKLVLRRSLDDMTGQVTPQDWQLMQGNVQITPRRTVQQLGRAGTHVEVYLPEQSMVVFTDDEPVLVTHISSGTGEEWCEEVTIDPGEQGNEEGEEPLKKGICGVAKTPGGTYYFNRRYVEGDGWREGALGRMFKPVYFNYGIAVHGSGNVPDRPASHGCVRTPMHIAEYFPDLVKYGDFIYVWDGEREPELYGRQLPVFDRPDPDYSTTSTTSSTTTTTVPETTAAPPTTSRPTTTAARPATTVPQTTVAEATTTTAISEQEPQSPDG